MPWQESTAMSERQEFLGFAQQEGANISELCRRYGISRKTAYKWLGRITPGQEPDYADRSRRPQTSPRRRPRPSRRRSWPCGRPIPPGERASCGRSWRARTCRRPCRPRAPSRAILRRHDQLHPPVRSTRDYLRFTAEAPNELWQLDFMGQPDLPTGKVHPLTVLDDHARFALAVVACPHQQAALVREQLTALFARYGLPRRILCDNGPPWGSAATGGMTALEAWWIQLGIAVSHGRPHHPQTQGKIERLHRTIWAEVRGIRDLPALPQGEG